ncbi:MAG: CvpA family protein [Sphingomonadaceae bacterium]|nr:CvpA family protein [Sphingomonadaceae bacterium]
MADPTIFDILVLIALATGLISGFLRGLVQELLSIAALVAAFITLRFAHLPLSDVLEPRVGVGAPLLAFALIVAIVGGGGKYLATRIGAQSRASLIGPVDRLLGAGFGILKALLIVTTIFMLFTIGLGIWYGDADERPEWLESSRTYPLLRASGSVVSAIVAERLATDGAPQTAPQRNQP